MAAFSIARRIPPDRLRPNADVRNAAGQILDSSMRSLPASQEQQEFQTSQTEGIRDNQLGSKQDRSNMVMTFCSDVITATAIAVQAAGWCAASAPAGAEQQ
jgi:hypothetical protein